MIISASRRTDIPAFYSKWFMSRVEDGNVMVRNPIYPRNITEIILKPERIDAIVFWTKNPQNFIQYLPELDDRGFFYYFLFTVTPYGNDFEAKVPPKNQMIEVFQKLSGILGKDRVIWRYDPIIFTKKTNENYHLDQFYNIASALKNCTFQCITSFMVEYKKCIRNMLGMQIEHPDYLRKKSLLCTLKSISESFGMSLKLCADEETIEGIEKACCIDPVLISNRTGKHLKNKKDISQRVQCCCNESIDIGVYNTCLHQCLYCYANYNTEKVSDTVSAHLSNSPLLVGELNGNENIRIK